MSNRRTWILLGLVLAAALFRLVNTGLPNISPVAAMALLGGAYLTDRRLAVLAPLAAMLLSDWFIGFHDTMWAVYLGLALTAGIGMWVGRHRTAGAITAGSLAGSTVFFLLTNFAVWFGSGYYPQTWDGFVLCYTMAIPFFHYSLAGDLAFTALLVGGFEWASRRFPSLAIGRV